MSTEDEEGVGGSPLPVGAFQTLIEWLVENHYYLHPDRGPISELLGLSDDVASTPPSDRVLLFGRDSDREILRRAALLIKDVATLSLGLGVTSIEHAENIEHLSKSSDNDAMIENCTRFIDYLQTRRGQEEDDILIDPVVYRKVFVDRDPDWLSDMSWYRFDDPKLKKPHYATELMADHHQHLQRNTERQQRERLKAAQNNWRNSSHKRSMERGRR